MKILFTLERLFEIIQAEIPEDLESVRAEEIGGIDARHTQIKKNEVYFDIDDEVETLHKAIAAGCMLIVTSRPEMAQEVECTIPVIAVPDAIEAYIRTCHQIAADVPNVIRIGVTGSSGKTSMKEMIAFLLSQAVSTGKNHANNNNLVGLAKQMSAIRPNNRFYVQEIGLKGDGKGMYTLKMSEAFKPNIAVITNINDNHSEFYHSRDNIFYHKRSVVEELCEGGIALLNKDDAILAKYTPNCTTLYYSVRDSSADVYASNIRIVKNSTVFDAHIQGHCIKDVTLQSIVEANIYNTLVAIAIARLHGIDDETILRGVKRHKSNFSTRENFTNIAGYNLYIDCFNSSPESVKYDVDFLAAYDLPEGARRVAVLGDIAELGEQSDALHTAVGEAISTVNFDLLFCFGEKSEFIYKAASKNKKLKVFHTTDRNKLDALIKANIKPGDLIVWKASHCMHLELTIDNIFGTDLYTLYPLSEEESVALSSGDYVYSAYANGGQIKKYNKNDQFVYIPPMLKGTPVRSIATQAFLNKNVVQIALPNKLVHIGNSAFYRCQNLSQIKFPDSLKFIHNNAFNRCFALEELKIPRACTHIGAQAFQLCKRLKSVYIPNADTYIDTNAFDRCPDLVIHCKENSYAHRYALKNGIKYAFISEVYQPPVQYKDIVIKGIHLEHRNGTVRLVTDIVVGNNEPDVLWWEFDEQWAPYVCTDRCDAMVVILFLYAMRSGYDRIVSELPISEKLWVQLTNHLIPQICKVEQEIYPRIQIVAPKTNEVYKKKKTTNATGFSRGVDSFATLYEYGHNADCPEDYKINLLTVYNVGAFHGKDVGLRSSRSSHQLFEGHLAESVAFAKKRNYNIMSVNSNLAFFLDDNFGHYPFQNSATEHNLGTTLLFQKMIDRFYYSSGHTMEEFKLSLTESSARWEQYAVQFFSTENTCFYIANQDWNRMEKIERVAQMPESYDDLQVCLVEIGNCGVCTKCRRTLMNLDVLGDDVLERYRGSFDIDTYRAQHREEWFSTIYTDKETDHYIYEIFKYGVEHNSELIPQPKVQPLSSGVSLVPKVRGIIVKELPTVLSKELALVQNYNFNMKVIGKVGTTWYKVALDDGRIGYVQENLVTLASRSTGCKAAAKPAVKRALPAPAKKKAVAKKNFLKEFAKKVLPTRVKNWIKKNILHR